MLLKDRMDKDPVTDILFLLADFFTNGSNSLIVFNRFIISGKLKPGALLIAKHKGLTRQKTSQEIFTCRQVISKVQSVSVSFCVNGEYNCVSGRQLCQQHQIHWRNKE